MLTDLGFLSIGQMWPPPSEVDRLKLYDRNRKLFENKHDEVYAEQFKRIQRVIGNFQNVISYAVLANFQKLISLKVADLLLGDPPKILVGKEDSQEQEVIDTICSNSDFNNTAYQAVIDISRMGDGLFFIYKDADTSAGKIDVTQPSIWFPVVSPDNIKKVQYHVLAWTFDVIESNDGVLNRIMNGKVQKSKHLKVQIHSISSYEVREYLLKDGQIVAMLGEPTTIKTGLNDFAIIQVSNTITSDRVFGIDDYGDIDSIVSELEVRVSQIAKVLDKHAEPSVSGPSSALRQDPQTGEYHLKMGNFFARDNNEDPETKYITWDASLEANFKYIEKLVNLLYTISEMGSAIFGDMEGHRTGQIPSGSALRRLMISPLAKVRRIRMRLDPALKKAIKLCSQLGGEGIQDLSKASISIQWNDGLPQDPLEEAQIMQVRTGDKPTISQVTAIERLDGLNEEDAQIELDLIRSDEASTNPLGGNNFPYANSNANNGGE
ncbi:MAG: phage portal protein [Bacillota bacterium]|nr:phage portal protein [Bacillota bacterium]